MRRLKGLPWARLAAEFGVIVIGVLVALAGDRWAQDRAQASLEKAYLVRFEAEAREDSALAERYLDRMPAAMAAVDTLLGFVDGASPVPENLRVTIITAFRELSLPPPSVWNEVLASGSLMILSDPEVREAISVYHGRQRPAIALNLGRADGRGRDKFLDATYQIGVGVPSEDGGWAPVDAEAFRDWPGMRQLLLGLASGHGTQRQFAGGLVQNASRLLDVLAQ